MVQFLRLGVICSFLISLVSLFVLILRTFAFNRKPIYAEPYGSGNKGVFYSLGQGMLPWEKESGKNHLLTYIAGILYHSGIFAALFYTITVVILVSLDGFLINLLRIFIFGGIVCGVGLLLKRISIFYMRQISCLDDFASNIFVNIYLIMTLVDSFIPSTRPIFFLAAIILLLYIPVGKIRHCFFFFYSRILFGLFFGRRGVLPHKLRQFKI